MAKDKQTQKTFEDSLRDVLSKGQVAPPPGLFDEIYDELEGEKKPLILYWLSAASIVILMLFSLFMFDKGTPAGNQFVESNLLETHEKTLDDIRLVEENQVEKTDFVLDTEDSEVAITLEEPSAPIKTVAGKKNKKILTKAVNKKKDLNNARQEEPIIVLVNEEELNMPQKDDPDEFLTQEIVTQPVAIVASKDEVLTSGKIESATNKKVFSSFSDVKDHMVDKIADGENVAFAYNKVPAENPELKDKRKIKLKINGFQFKASF